MSRPREDDTNYNKADRALKLHEQGLTSPEIAERLGCYSRNVREMLRRARERRAKKRAKVSDKIED